MIALFDDTYKGPRYRYGLNYRPLGLAQVPMGWIIWSDRKDERFNFGTLDYPERLPDGQVKNFQLTFMGEVEVKDIPKLSNEDIEYYSKLSGDEGNSNFLEKKEE